LAERGLRCNLGRVVDGVLRRVLEIRMPKLSIERSHKLSVDEAKKRLVSLADRLAEKYSLKSTWKTPTEAEVKGTGATGKIVCAPDKVTVTIDLSFALTPLKGKIEERVTKELETALA